MANTFTQPINLTTQLSLDIRQEPLNEVIDLTGYGYTYAYVGLEVLVKNNGRPIKFTMNDTSYKKYSWIISSPLTADTFEALESFTTNTVATLSTSKNKSKAFTKGLKAVVLADENNNGEMSEYIVIDVVDGIPTWSLIKAGEATEFDDTDLKNKDIDLQEQIDELQGQIDDLASGATGDVEAIVEEKVSALQALLDDITERVDAMENSGVTDTFIVDAAKVEEGTEVGYSLIYNDTKDSLFIQLPSIEELDNEEIE